MATATSNRCRSSDTCAGPASGRLAAVRPRSRATSSPTTCLNQQFWRKLCQVLEMRELTEDPRFRTNANRVQHRETIIPMLQERLAQRGSEDWLRTLEAADVP